MAPNSRHCIELTAMCILWVASNWFHPCFSFFQNELTSKPLNKSLNTKITIPKHKPLKTEPQTPTLNPKPRDITKMGLDLCDCPEILIGILSILRLHRKLFSTTFALAITVWMVTTKTGNNGIDDLVRIKLNSDTGKRGFKAHYNERNNFERNRWENSCGENIPHTLCWWLRAKFKLSNSNFKWEYITCIMSSLLIVHVGQSENDLHEQLNAFLQLTQASLSWLLSIKD